MRTDFFQSINNLQEASSWKIDIAFTDENRMIVTVFSTEQKDTNTPPVAIFVGSPKDLNEVFFDALLSRSNQSASLFLNVEVRQQAVLPEKKAVYL